MYRETHIVKRTILALTALVIGTLNVAAQASPDFMRSTGKFYVVVAVLAVILILLFGYLFILDRKLTRIENQMNNEHQEKN